MPSPSDLIVALRARSATIVRVTPLGENQAVLTLKLGEDTVQATVSIREVIGDLTPSRQRVTAPKTKIARAQPK